MKKRHLAILVGLLALSGCSGSAEKAEAAPEVALIQFEEPKSGDKIATMATSMGVIKIHLFPKEAPKAVENFVTHAQEGYYNHLTFHRVIADFMIQGGDPKGNGTGGESIWHKPFADEFSDQLYHFDGALSMANSGKDTNGSQFFIIQNHDGSSYDEDYFENVYAQAQKRKWTNAGFVHPDKVKEKYREVGGIPYLDHQHTVFGQVIEGMDVIEKIASVQTGVEDRPVVDILIESITIETVK